MSKRLAYSRGEEQNHCRHGNEGCSVGIGRAGGGCEGEQQSNHMGRASGDCAPPRQRDKKSHSPEQRQKVEGVNMAEQGHQQARSRKPLTY